MCAQKNICPVPFDQQPLNEFYALKSSCFFSFFGFRLNKYLSSILVVSLLVMFFSTPLVLLIIKFSWTQFLVTESFFIICTLIFVLARLYLGWSYIMQRLFSATIFYEESGWYDGQIWVKTPEMLTKDRLIATYYILPLLKRIQGTFAFLLVISVLYLIFYRLLCY